MPRMERIMLRDGVKGRFGWEWNGMRLHEMYFGNLTKNRPNLAADYIGAVLAAADWDLATHRFEATRAQVHVSAHA